MRRSDERTGMESLDPEECWKLLDESSVGRLVLIVDGHPDIFPVNYRTLGSVLLVRTGPGTKSSAARSDRWASFEIDALDAERETGWSVVVHGPIQQIDQTDELSRAQRHGLQSWAPGQKDQWLQILPRHVTGRRIPHRD